MTTLAEHIIVVRAENRPLMLKKSMYDSWASRIHLFIKKKKHGRMMLDSIDNGPLVYLTIEENGQTRPMKYSELTKVQQLQDECDVPPDAYALLINDMHTIGITMQQVQVNTKFLNALPLEWSKFVTDVKLAKSLYTTNYDHFQLSNSIQSILVTTTLRTSSNPRNQATIQDGRVTVQQVQGRQNQSYAGEGHMARQCTQPKRPRNATWFMEKLMLVEAQEASKILDEEQLAFLADPGILEVPVAQ
nr:hypothetical protein [Tanacetum cinerariifolium]